MQSRPLILYHASCPDGFCAAWVAHRILGDDADYLPVQYGQEPPDVTGRQVYILDFSYKRSVLEAMSRNAESIIVLDHHKTAKEELETIGRDPLSGYLAGGKTLLCVFDMNKSGGRLAWEHFCTDPRSSWANCPVPWLVEYTEDRDLWRWKLPESKEINAALASWPRTFAEWDKLAFDTTAVPYFAEQGAAILRYQSGLVDAAVANAVETELAGHKIKAVNSTVLLSEIAGELAKDRPFGAAYFIRGDGKKQWSLRSRDGGVDVSQIAKQFGGGGHRNAAGFEER